MNELMVITNEPKLQTWVANDEQNYTQCTIYNLKMLQEGINSKCKSNIFIYNNGLSRKKKIENLNKYEKAINVDTK